MTGRKLSLAIGHVPRFELGLFSVSFFCTIYYSQEIEVLGFHKTRRTFRLRYRDSDLWKENNYLVRACPKPAFPYEFLASQLGAKRPQLRRILT